MFEKPKQETEQTNAGVEGIESELGNDIESLEVNSEQLESALDSVGGEEGLEKMISELPEDSRNSILSALEEEHESRMRKILRAQEKAGKMMDDGTSFIWNPKFVYQEGLKNDKSYDPAWAAGKAGVTTAAIFGTGTNLAVGLGVGTVGAVKHFISRFKELREQNRYEKEKSAVE